MSCFHLRIWKRAHCIDLLIISIACCNCWFFPLQQREQNEKLNCAESVRRLETDLEVSLETFTDAQLCTESTGMLVDKVCGRFGQISSLPLKGPRVYGGVLWCKWKTMQLRDVYLCLWFCCLTDQSERLQDLYDLILQPWLLPLLVHPTQTTVQR